MATDNTITLVGNATREPELRFTNSGQALASFGVAINKRKRNDRGEWENGDPSFFDITCWGQLAENVAESVQKGTRVVVTGRLDQRSWETQDGDKRSKVEVVADEVAPSLRWATAQITRNERRGGDGGGRGTGESGGGGDPGPSADYDPDEEPF